MQLELQQLTLPILAPWSKELKKKIFLNLILFFSLDLKTENFT